MDLRKTVQMKCINYSVTSHKRFSQLLLIALGILLFIFFNEKSPLLSRASYIEYSQFLPFTSIFLLKIKLHLWIFWAMFTLFTIFFISLFLFWIFYCGWYYTWFRYCAYGISWFYSRLRLFFTQKGVKFIILYTLILLIPLVLVPILQTNSAGFIKESTRFIKDLFRVKDYYLTPASLLTTFIIAVIITLLARLIKASQHLVITEFADNTEKGEGNKTEVEKIVQRIPGIFQYEFGRVIYLLKNFEAIKGTATRKGVGFIEYTSDIKNFKTYDAMVGSEMNIKIGSFLNIPIGWLIKFFSHLLQGPSLNGSLHKEGDVYILIGSIRGWKHNRSWRVYSTEIEEPGTFSDDEIISKLAKLLAWRILSELVDFGSLNWKAVNHYLTSLFYLRESHLTTRKRVQKLKKAQKAAEQAIKGDEYFSECYYNLGTIYLDLNDKHAAETAFRKAIKIKPEYHRCYYELAQIYYEDKKYLDASWFCNQALELMPSEANYWNFRGVIKYIYNDILKRKEDNSSSQQKNSSIITGYFLKASALSWKALCKIRKNPKNETIETQRKLKEAKENAALCLRNLAVTQRDNGKKNPIPLFKQALLLNACDCDLYLEMGKYFLEKGHINKAYNCIIKVFEDSPEIDNIEFWVYFLLISILRKKKKYPPKSKNKESGIWEKKYNENINNISMLLLNTLISQVQNSHEDKMEELLDRLNEVIDDKVTGIIQKVRESQNNNIALPKIIPLISRLEETIIPIDEEEKGPGIQKQFSQVIYIIYNLLRKGPFEDREWSEGQRRILEVLNFLPQEKAEKNEIAAIVKPLEQAIDYLKENHFRSIIQMGINKTLAEVYMNTKKYELAVIYALYAVRLNPFGHDEQKILNEAYTAMKASWLTKSKGDGISAQFSNRFPDFPDKKKIIGEIGGYYLSKIRHEYRQKTKAAIYDEAIQFFKNAQKVFLNIGSEDDWCIPDEANTSSFQEIGQISYYMGLLAEEAEDTEGAVSYFRMAVTYGYETPPSNH